MNSKRKRKTSNEIDVNMHSIHVSTKFTNDATNWAYSRGLCLQNEKINTIVRSNNGKGIKPK